MSRITEFYRISPAAPAREQDEASRDKYYRRLRLQAFVAATLGYSLYYVCRTSLNVMKKPILDSGSLDASQLGVIGSALLFAYAIGKFVNGFIADYCNIKRFMATGLIVSAAANALMGLMGLAHSVVPTAVIFVAFAVMWGLNGWAQSMGAPPAIISLSRWYPLKERGTYYGFFSAFIGENYADTGIKESLLAKSFKQSVIFKFKSFKNFGIGEESNFCSRFIRIFKHFCGSIRFSAFILLKNVFMRS